MVKKYNKCLKDLKYSYRGTFHFDGIYHNSDANEYK